MGTQNHRSPPTLGPWGIGTPRDPPSPDSAPWCLGTFVNAGMGHVGTAVGTRTPTPVGTAPQVPPRWGWGCSSAAGCPPTPPPPHVTQCPLMPPTQRSQAGEEEEEEGDSTPQPWRPHGWHLAGRWDKDLGDTGTPHHPGDRPALVNSPPPNTTGTHHPFIGRQSPPGLPLTFVGPPSHRNPLQLQVPPHGSPNPTRPPPPIDLHPPPSQIPRLPPPPPPMGALGPLGPPPPFP